VSDFKKDIFKRQGEGSEKKFNSQAQ